MMKQFSFLSFFFRGGKGSEVYITPYTLSSKNNVYDDITMIQYQENLINPLGLRSDS